jgi:AcrR family transcriptional regulator
MSQHSHASAASGRRRASPKTPEERRAAIIKTTIPLLRTRGWTVTTKEIVAASGVSDGTVFSVFKNKEEILLAALQAALDAAPALERLSQIDRSLPLEDRLAQAAEILTGLMATLWEFSGTLQLEEVRGRLPQRYSGDFIAREILPALFEPSRDDLRIDPAVASQAFLVLTMTGSNQLFFQRPLQAPEIVSMMLHGIRRSDSDGS